MAVKTNLSKGRIFLFILINAIICLMYISGMFSQAQLKISDAMHGDYPTLDKIKIVAIDDKSLQDIGRWPWQRSNFSKIIENLEDAKLIGIDVAFFERSDEKQDKDLAEQISRSGNVILAAEYSEFEKQDGKVIGKTSLLPITLLREAALGIGYINVNTDKDGITRSVNINIGGNLSSFQSEIYSNYFGKFSGLSEQDELLIRFVGPPGSFEKKSASDIINRNFSDSFVNDNIILIGATAPDLHDDFLVPTSDGDKMPGVEVHANAIQNMILENSLTKASGPINILLILIASAILFILFKIDLNHYVIATLSFAMIITYLIFGILIFEKGVVLNYIYPPLSIVASFIGNISFSYYSEKKAKSEIVGAFGKYVSPLVVDQIIKNPSMLKLGGEKRKITVLFSDIRSFTSLSESMAPEDLVNFLNEYLSRMTTIILNKKGLVDKYIGDAIMAFWGAPLDEKEQERLACEAAIEMEEETLKIRDEKGGHFKNFDIGIGINTGYAVVGNLGSYERFDYTAIGDSINLGSRLEGLNKEYGTRILISESTYDNLMTDKKINKQKKRSSGLKTKEKSKILMREIVTREIDKVKVKGKNKPVRIYQLMRDSEKDQDKIIEYYGKGLEKYRSKRWDEATKYFQKAADLNKDTPSEKMIERCNLLKKKEKKNEKMLPKDWDGVFEMKTK